MEFKGFEQAFVRYVEWLGASGLIGDELVRTEAEAAWDRWQKAKEKVKAAQAAEVAARLADFQPQDMNTWTLSGRIKYTANAPEGYFTPDQKAALARAAEFGEGIQERRAAWSVGKGLHAHLNGGTKGVSLAFVLAEDGQVDLLVYDLAEGRNRNDYRWSGGANTAGPSSLLATLGGDPVLVASARLVGVAQQLQEQGKAVAPPPGATEPPAVPSKGVAAAIASLLGAYHKATQAHPDQGRKSRKKRRKGQSAAAESAAAESAAKAAAAAEAAAQAVAAAEAALADFGLIVPAEVDPAETPAAGTDQPPAPRAAPRRPPSGTCRRRTSPPPRAGRHRVSPDPAAFRPVAAARRTESPERGTGRTRQQPGRFQLS